MYQKGRTTYALHDFIYIMCIICLRFFPVRGKNLATGGKTYQTNTDGILTPTFVNGPCPTSQVNEGASWRVDFDKLIEVYAIEITPGKLER